MAFQPIDLWLKRRHLLPRNLADDVDNTINFKQSTIQRVLLTRMASLESFNERPGLTNKNAAICPELDAALGADAVLAAGGYFDGIEIRRDDVLLVDGHTLSLSAVCKWRSIFFLGPCIRRGAILVVVVFVDATLGRGEVMALGCSCSQFCDEVPM